MRAIDAEDAKTIIQNTVKHLAEAGNGAMAGSLLYAVEVIDNVPTIEPVKQDWISVKDRLPEISVSDNTCEYTVPVLAFGGGCVMFGYFKIYIYDGYWGFNGIDEDDYEWCCISAEVTHWMPLPEPPKMDGE